MRGLDDDAERAASAAAEREEQVAVLARVRGAKDTVGCDHLDLHLRRESQPLFNAKRER